MIYELQYYTDEAAAVVLDAETAPSLIYVGGAGTVSGETVNGSVVTFTVPAGGRVPCLLRKVLTAGTSATLMMRCF